MTQQPSNALVPADIAAELQQTRTLADAHIATKTVPSPDPSSIAMARQRVNLQAKRVRGMFTVITNPQIRKDPK